MSRSLKRAFSRRHPFCGFGGEIAGSRGRQRGLFRTRATLGSAPGSTDQSEGANHHASQWGHEAGAPPRPEAGGLGPSSRHPLTWLGLRPWPGCGRSGTCRSLRSVEWVAPRRRATSPCSAGSRRPSWCPSRPRWWGLWEPPTPSSGWNPGPGEPRTWWRSGDN